MMNQLSETLYRVPRGWGLQELQRRGEGAARELSTWRLCLRAGEKETFSRPGEETVLVLQQGKAILRVADASWEVSRAGVFEEPATSLYLPPGATLDVEATEELEAILIAAAVAKEEVVGEATLMPPQEVAIVERGRDAYRRTVHDIWVRNPVPRRLLVGETFNPPGHWSSFPPHKHDGGNGEPRLEEVYYYRIAPEGGFAQQILYASGEEPVTHTVRDGDAVLLPHGYHPVAAPPGYQLYYLWALAGEERRLALYEDPEHRWIHGA